CTSLLRAATAASVVPSPPSPCRRGTLLCASTACLLRRTLRGWELQMFRWRLPTTLRSSRRSVAATGWYTWQPFHRRLATRTTKFTT
ncbi:MAG: UDP-glucose 4-epimerase, partial [uncultured Chloroflexia bacterium]